MSVAVEVTRCSWARTPQMIAYHDKEWGTPLHDDRKLFEMLTLEGAQAGLSWETILNKRANYRKAFDNFDFNKVARYGKREITALLRDAGIVRNKLKIESTINNARAIVALRESGATFDKYLWSFVDGKPVVSRPKSLDDVLSESPVSQALSKDLKSRGFRFVGPTIMYAFMQATGIADDHMASCFRATKK